MRGFWSLALSAWLGGFAYAAAPEASQTPAELTLPAGTRLALQLNNHLSTRSSREGDTFTANVIAPVYQGDRLVVPKGSTVTGRVSRIVRPGRFRGKALMDVSFESIRVPGRGELELRASLMRVESEGNAGVDTEGTVRGEGSVGSDVGRVLKPGLAGAGVGAIGGGGSGAAIGGGVGALVGLATVFSTRGKDLDMRRGSTMEITLDRPLAVPLEGDLRSGRIR